MKKTISKNKFTRDKDRKTNFRKEATKDSGSKRMNFDNARVSKIEKDVKEWKSTGASNDVRWYAHNPEMLRAAATIPFSNYTGEPFPWLDPTVADSAIMQSIPGVMALEWTPQIGGNNLDPINQAANSIYSFVVHANSRNKSYDAPDLMMMVLAGAQIFSALAVGYRVYGAMRLYSQDNSYLPAGLVKAMGFDHDNLKDNLAKMWFDLNELAARSKQIWIPNTMPLIERWYWMNTNVYMDSKSVKDQYYLYKQIQFLKLSETGSTEGTSLIPVTAGSTSDWLKGVMTWSKYMSMMNEMFNAYLDSQDRGIMSGDILKAYGADKLYSVQPITSDYQIVPTYDIEVLTQMSNATLCPGTVLSGIKQNVGATSVGPRIYATYSYVNASNGSSTVPTGASMNTYVLSDWTWLNFKTDVLPTPEMVMVATRLAALGNVKVTDSANSGKYVNIPEACGTETLLSVKMIWRGRLNNATAITLNQEVIMNHSDMTNTINNLLNGCLQAFDWRPPIMKFKYFTNDFGTDVAPVVKLGTIQCEYEYGTGLFKSVLTKMHNTAVYSLFGVPVM